MTFTAPFSPVFYPVFGVVEADGWSPLDLAGLQIWIDFSDITTLYQDSTKTTPVVADNDPIGCAADKSGNSNDHIQATASAMPTYKTGIQNGLSVSRYDGGDKLKCIHNMTTVRNYMTGFMVGKANAAGTYAFHVLESGYIGASNVVYMHRTHSTSATRRWIYFYDTSGNVIGSLPYNGDYTIWHVDTCELDIPSAYHYYNAGSAVLVGTNASYNQTGNYQPSWIGGDGNFNRLIGDIGEVLLYDSALSDDDRALVIGYLMEKWGII